MGIPAPLPAALTQPGADGRLMATEYLEVITRAITNHPRSQQAEIGPSEIGVECGRRIAYKLLDVPERPQPPNWIATVGTGVHGWLETAFDADNVDRAAHLGGQERWLVETRLTVGFVPGLGFITGSCDLYDRVTGTVVDHKIVGPTALRKYKSQGPSLQYRVQAHLYGQGWFLAGQPIDRVAIAFLPRNAPLSEAHIWSEPWQPDIAKQALDRLAEIQRRIGATGTAALAGLNTFDNYCSHCPWLRVGSTDPATGCPGAAGAVNTTAQLDGLIDSAA